MIIAFHSPRVRRFAEPLAAAAPRIQWSFTTLKNGELKAEAPGHKPVYGDAARRLQQGHAPASPEPITQPRTGKASPLAKAKSLAISFGKHAAKAGAATVGAGIALEHFAKDFGNHMVSKLPHPLQVGIYGSLKAFQSTYTAANKAVEAVGKERGLNEEQIKTISKWTSLIDYTVGAKGGAISGKMVGGAVGGFVGSMVPLGSLGYLAYSTAKDPLATIRAAKKGIKAAIAAVREKFRDKAGELDAPTKEQEPPADPSTFAEHSGLKGLGHYKPQKSLEEAKAHARSLGITKINLGPDLDTANHVLASLTALRQTHGIKMPRNLEYADNANVAATMSPDGKTLTIYKGMTDKLKKLRTMPPEELAQRRQEGLKGQPGFYMLDGDPHSDVVHEIGHMRSFTNGGRAKSQAAYDKFYKHTVEDLANEMSGYGLKSPEEFVAETYVGLMLGRKMSKKVKDAFEEFGGKYP